MLVEAGTSGSAALAEDRCATTMNNKAIVARCLALVADVVEYPDSVTSAAFKLG